MFEKLQEIAIIKAQRDLQGNWYQGPETYINSLVEETYEVKAEITSNRQCNLEDELGDLLWNVACLLEHLDITGDIDKNEVLKRAIKKYSERVVYDRLNDETWESIKEKQKLELEAEYADNVSSKS